MKKLFGTQNLEGKLYLRNQRLRFESGKLERLFGLGNMGFDIAFKNILRVSKGKKLLEKTMLLHVEGAELEFSYFAVDGFIENLKREIWTSSCLKEEAGRGQS